MKQTVAIAKSEQTAIPELGKDSKTLYYLIIGEGPDKLVINVGEKTYNKVHNLIMLDIDENLKKPQDKITETITKTGIRKTA